MMKYER